VLLVCQSKAPVLRPPKMKLLPEVTPLRKVFGKPLPGRLRPVPCRPLLFNPHKPRWITYKISRPFRAPPFLPLRPPCGVPPPPSSSFYRGGWHDGANGRAFFVIFLVFFQAATFYRFFGDSRVGDGDAPFMTFRFVACFFWILSFFPVSSLPVLFIVPRVASGGLSFPALPDTVFLFGRLEPFSGWSPPPAFLADGLMLPSVHPSGSDF